MPRKYFGTDGIRAQANTPPMTAEIAMRLGMAAGKYFMNGGERRHIVVIGKDTRLSGYMIESALMAGFTSVGMDVTVLGPMPTPAVANMTRSLRADLGVMISASHNKYQDNGLKLFGPEGYKLSDEIEHEIEAMMEAAFEGPLAAPNDIGRAVWVQDAQARYIEIVKAAFPKRMTLAGLRICIDCANGAGYSVAPKALYELGAEVIPLGNAPNGFNINEEVGSTDTRQLQDAVVKYRADIGIALDGDADRLTVIDEKGDAIDGDQILGMVAAHWHTKERLTKPGIVTTVMSNMGLEEYLASLGLEMPRTQVGDRYVAAYMRKHGYNVGGEQSGHIILSDFCTTGDGLLAALQTLAVIIEQDKPLSECATVFEPAPQELVNIRYNGSNPMEDKTVQASIKSVEKSLGSKGRLLVRKSGTEPLIRVMAESRDSEIMEAAVAEVVDAVRAVT